jgi:hypothetical protein
MRLTGWRWVAVGRRDEHELGRVRKSIFFVAVTGDYCIIDVQFYSARSSAFRQTWPLVAIPLREVGRCAHHESLRELIICRTSAGSYVLTSVKNDRKESQ